MVGDGCCYVHHVLDRAVHVDIVIPITQALLQHTEQRTLAASRLRLHDRGQFCPDSTNGTLHLSDSAAHSKVNFAHCVSLVVDLLQRLEGRKL